MILPFQGSSTPPDIRQQAEHLLHEYELDDETLQEAQLEQHKIFQNFPTSPAPAASSAPPPLATGTKLKVPSTHGQDHSDNDSCISLFHMEGPFLWSFKIVQNHLSLLNSILN